MAKKTNKAIAFLLVVLCTFLSVLSIGIPAASAAAPSRASASVSLKNLKVYPGGVPFGVKFLTEGIIIVGFAEVTSAGHTVCPAKQAGLCIGDVILKINGTSVDSANRLAQILKESQATPLTVVYKRNGKEATTTVTPVYSDAEDRYTTGLYLRDSGAGIGTVTFVIPKTCAFAGLGHGICDAHTGDLLPIQRGSVVDVTISGVVRGLSGSPGEVKGYFASGKTGTLLGNTHCGVYGVLARLPEKLPSEPISLGLRDEITEGRAYIYSMLDSDCPQKYEIEISEIRRDSTDNKSFTVKVTDKALISKTGGIIQGMSGSPIIQNGKLVGAVTHVLINDPTTGYGIFIENMLNASQMPMARAS
ncbi:MAG: SpoIVB peptidase [Clostridia bacterium]|nr:SpoIVB peptidase [Clostridia bacterium]